MPLERDTGCGPDQQIRAEIEAELANEFNGLD